MHKLFKKQEANYHSNFCLVFKQMTQILSLQDDGIRSLFRLTLRIELSAGKGLWSLG